MRFFYFILLVGFCFTNNSIAQLSVVWENNTNAYYSGKPVLAQEYVIDSEGNTIVAGYSQYGNYNSDRTVFVMKIAPDGTELWKQTFTQDLTDYDTGTVNGLFVDENDNIILFAKFFVQKVIKYDKDGNFISFDAYDFGLPITFNIYNEDYLFDRVHQDNGGNLYIGGLIPGNNGGAAYSYRAEFNPQGGLYDSRYDLRGDSLSQRSYITLLHPGNDKTMFLFANCWNATNTGILVSKLDAEGALEWTNVNWISNQDIYYQRFKDVLMDYSGNFYLAINTTLRDNTYFGSLMKLDPTGVLMWEVPLADYEFIQDIEFDSGGNIWVSIDNSGGSGSTILKKFSSAAQLLATVNSGTGDAAFRTQANYNNDVYVLERKGVDGLYISKYDWSGAKIEELKLVSGYVQQDNIGFFEILANNDIIAGYSQPVSSNSTYIVKVTDGATSVDEEALEHTFSLSQNYPNPFNPTTQVIYTIPKSGNVSLIIYDMLGREVKTLVNQFQNAGSYTIDFNAGELSSGVYFYRITTGSFIETNKMMLLK